MEKHRAMTFANREQKLERLLRYHRQNVFCGDAFKEDCHSRALGRLKKTKTFAGMCEKRRQAQAARVSDRLLSLYA